MTRPRSTAPPDFFDQPVVDEGADEVADRGPGETCEPRQVGPRERTLIVEPAQHQLLIERSRLLVRCLFGKYGPLAPIGGGRSSIPRPIPLRRHAGFGKRLD